MASIIYRGTDEPQLQYVEIKFDPNTGNTVEKEFKGISYAKMAALANQYGASRWSGSLRSEQGVATLTLSSAAGTSGAVDGYSSPVNDITDKWEISVDQERPDLCENWYFRYLLSPLEDGAGSIRVTDQVASQLRSVASGDNATRKQFFDQLKSVYIVDLEGNQLSTNATLYDQWDAKMAGNKEEATKFIDDYLRGANTFVRGKYVLRHTTNVPSDYGANVSDWNIEKIYSIAQLLSEAESSSLWILPLPGYLAYKIANYPAPPSLPSSYQWGALKLRSNASTAAYGRIEISTEYLIDAWPIHTYGLAT